ncbi:MAG: ferritin-like domain-containing protein [archaeon]
MVEDILKKVLKQEFEAERRYTDQINKIKNLVVKKLLMNLREAEIDHKEECIERLQEIDSGFDDSRFKSRDKITNFVKEDNIDEIVQMLELDIEKEREAGKLYLGYSKEVNNIDISTLLMKFREDELEHAAKLINLVNQLKL